MQMRTTAVLIIAIVSLGLASAGAVAAPGAPGLVRTVRVPDDGIQPRAAVDAAGVLHVIYTTGEPAGADAFYIRSEDGGASFSDPIRVNSEPGSVFPIGTVRGLAMAVGREGRVHAAWMGRPGSEPAGPDGATPMLYTRLNDAGDAFEPQRNVMTASEGLDGGGTIAADGEGHVYVAWHAWEPGEPHEEATRRIWVARSADGGETFGRERIADPGAPGPAGVCVCCGMDAIADPDGRLYLLYRTAFEAVHRDMRLLVSDDRGEGFGAVDVHGWRADVCPMSTASLLPEGDSLRLAWETEGRVYHARLNPGEGSPDPVAAARGGAGQKHPRLAANADGRVLLTWAEGTGWNRGGSIAWQLFDADGTPIPEGSGRADGLPVWSFPTAYGLPDGTFVILY